MALFHSSSLLLVTWNHLSETGNHQRCEKRFLYKVIPFQILHTHKAASDIANIGEMGEWIFGHCIMGNYADTKKHTFKEYSQENGYDWGK